MLDERSLYLLNIINSQCNGSEYKIFDLKELVDSFPDRLNTDIEQIRELLKDLALKEYVSVKYEDDIEICACPLQKGRLESETVIERQIERQKDSKKYFIYSFFGALLGGIFIASIIMLFEFFRV